MKKALLLLLLVIGVMTKQSFTQDQHLVDSLQTLLNTARQDTNKVNILIQLAKSILSNKPDKAMDYAQQILTLSKQIGYKKGVGIAYNIMGIEKRDKGDYIKAQEYFKKSLEISEEIGNKQGISISYINIGDIHFSQSNYLQAIEFYKKAIMISEKIGYKKGIALSCNKIGNIYYEQGNYPEALKNYFASLKIDEETGDKQGIADSRISIGLIYENQRNYQEALKNYSDALNFYEDIGDKYGIGLSCLNLGNINLIHCNYPEALKNYSASLKINEEIGNKESLSNLYCNIGIIYSRQGNYTEALQNQFISLKLAEENNKKYGIAISYMNIGYIYVRQKKYNDASQYLNKALSLSKEIGSLYCIKGSYENLSTLDSAKGNFKQALEHYKLYIAARDSLVNEEKTKKTVQQQMQYEFDKKESVAKADQEKKDAIVEKELQKQKLVRNGFIGGFAVMLLFAIVFFTQRTRIKKGKKRSEELLLNILPYEVAEELKLTGRCQAKTFSMVTVMFMDFKDFTSVSEKVSAELLVDEINYCFSAFDQIVQKYKVEKIKTVGDSYICVSGLPVLNYTHAIDVVNAAIEIRNFMLSRKKEKEERGEIPFELRIGIHTGPVVAGIVGIKKFAYDIWGDTVNIAARMEQNSEAGKINISGSTYGLVKDKFNCVYRGKIEAKNKGEVEMYFVETIS
jgi:adenylate cyclase